jgi:hypothetical protein
MGHDSGGPIQIDQAPALRPDRGEEVRGLVR